MNDRAKKVRFLDVYPEYGRYESAQFAVLPIPYEGTVSYGKGTAAGPEAIIQASSQVELYDEELCGEYYQAGVFLADTVDCRRAGPEDVQRRIHSASQKLLGDGKFVLALGGEHSVSEALVEAAARCWQGLSVLHMDAHADLRDSYQGSTHSHACVMRRIGELSLPTVSVGVRSYSAEESELLSGSPGRIISARQIAKSRGDPQAGEQWMDLVAEGLSELVYVTVDIDVFDPGEAPGTGTPEPGGLNWYEVTGLLRQVARAKKIVSADIVEVIPGVSGGITEFLAARLAYKIMAYSQQS